MATTATRAPKTFSLVYRRGPLRCSWHRVLETYVSREAAKTAAAPIERMGYKTLVFETAALNAIGLPEGWDATSPVEA